MHSQALGAIACRHKARLALAFGRKWCVSKNKDTRSRIFVQKDLLTPEADKNTRILLIKLWQRYSNREYNTANTDQSFKLRSSFSTKECQKKNLIHIRIMNLITTKSCESNFQKQTKYKCNRQRNNFTDSQMSEKLACPRLNLLSKYIPSGLPCVTNEHRQRAKHAKS